MNCTPVGATDIPPTCPILLRYPPQDATERPSSGEFLPGHITSETGAPLYNTSQICPVQEGIVFGKQTVFTYLL